MKLRHIRFMWELPHYHYLRGVRHWGVVVAGWLFYICVKDVDRNRQNTENNRNKMQAVAYFIYVARSRLLQFREGLSSSPTSVSSLHSLRSHVELSRIYLLDWLDSIFCCCIKWWHYCIYCLTYTNRIILILQTIFNFCQFSPNYENYIRYRFPTWIALTEV